MTYGLDGNGLVLLPRLSFHSRLTALVPASIPERKLKAIEPYIYSIDQKLNATRYSAGLLRSVQPDDYGKHYNSSVSGGHSSQTEYVGRCVYYAKDWEQYALSLLFFIDTFSAAAFSLFDNSGHLIKELYNLPITPDRVNFYEVTNEIKTKSPNFYTKFFAQYRLDEASMCKDWFKFLKKLRNHMTHVEVTDIVRLDTPMRPHPQEIFLRKDPISSPNDLVLKQFVEDCFNGLEEYVEQLYDKLAQQAENENSLPLTGRFDHLI